MGKTFNFFKAKPHLNRYHVLENRDFVRPNNNLSWKELAFELAKDKIRSKMSLFEYKKGTKSFAG